jgi:hypothetical protein
MMGRGCVGSNMGNHTEFIEADRYIRRCDRGLRVRFVGEVSGWLYCGSLNGTARLCLELLVPQLETTNKQWHTHAYTVNDD